MVENFVCNEAYLYPVPDWEPMEFFYWHKNVNKKKKKHYKH